jgi:SAM-dependent methyltransferase
MGSLDHKRSEEEIARINRIQSDFFGSLIEVFDPPLPEGVPERLERIVASARIHKRDIVLDVGTGTGVLVPVIQAYGPKRIVACDLSGDMLEHLKRKYPFVKTFTGDVRDMREGENTFDVVFINACYPNIVDKTGSMANIARMMRAHGRLVISHPMGKRFIERLKEKSPFPLDAFPEKKEAKVFLDSFGFVLDTMIDEPEMYLLLGVKRGD